MQTSCAACQPARRQNNLQINRCPRRRSLHKRTASGQAIAEGAVALWLIVTMLVAAVLLIMFTGACMLWQQKINFAVQGGAFYAAETVGPAAYFLGAPRPGAASPATLMTTYKPQITNAVQQTLAALGVPGGSTATVTPSAVTQGGVQMAEVQAAIGSFAIPGMPAGVPKFPGITATAFAPFTQVLDTPPALLKLQFYSPGNECVGEGPGYTGTALIPVYGTTQPSGVSGQAFNVISSTFSARNPQGVLATTSVAGCPTTILAGAFPGSGKPVSFKTP